jgi:hypothetical protein
MELEDYQNLINNPLAFRLRVFILAACEITKHRTLK